MAFNFDDPLSNFARTERPIQPYQNIANDPQGNFARMSAATEAAGIIPRTYEERKAINKALGGSEKTWNLLNPPPPPPEPKFDFAAAMAQFNEMFANYQTKMSEMMAQSANNVQLPQFTPTAMQPKTAAVQPSGTSSRRMGSAGASFGRNDLRIKNINV